MSRLALASSRVAATFRRVRMALAMRPCLPMTLPLSGSATSRWRMTLSPRHSSSTRTDSGLSTSDRAIYSTRSFMPALFPSVLRYGACSFMVRRARTKIPPRLGSRDLGKRFKMHSEAGPLQLSDGTALDRVPVALLEIGVTEVLVCGLVAEQMVGDDQQGVPDRDDSALAAAAGGQPLEERPEVAGLRPTGGPGRLAQGAPQPGASLTGPRRPAFAAALAVAGAHPTPGGQVLRGGETAHVRADFSQDNLSCPLSHAGNGPQPRHFLPKRGASLDLHVAAGDLVVEGSDALQLLLDYEAEHRAHLPDERSLEVGSLGLHPPVGQCRQRGGILFTVQQRIEDALAGDAEDVGQDGRQFDVGPLQGFLEAIDLARPLLGLGGAVAGQLSEFALIAVGDVTGWHQPVAQQGRQPLGVLDIRLPTWDGAHALRVRHDEREPALQDVIDGLPEGAGGLHDDMRDALAGEPVGHALQRARPSSERSRLPARGGQGAGDHGPLVDVQPGARGVHHLQIHWRTSNLLMPRWAGTASRQESRTRAL